MISACLAIIANLCIVNAERIVFPEHSNLEVSLRSYDVARIEGKAFSATLWESTDEITELWGDSDLWDDSERRRPYKGDELCDKETCVRYSMTCRPAPDGKQQTRCNVLFQFPADKAASNFFVEFHQQLNVADIADNIALLDANGTKQTIPLGRLKWKAIAR